MEYKAYVIQGNGCDYTIACGETVIDLEASNMEEAKIKIAEIIKENYCGEQCLQACKIYEVNSCEFIDVGDIYRQMAEDKRVGNQNAIDEADATEYERLKKKFGNA